MSSFCVSTDGTHSSKQAIFSHSKQNDKMGHFTQWHTKGFQNMKLVSLYSKSVSRENSKCLHFASVQMNHIKDKGIKAMYPLIDIVIKFELKVEQSIDLLSGLLAQFYYMVVKSGLH